jgi:pimeloyl-ACP methyl ester carboxylesterase
VHLEDLTGLLILLAVAAAAVLLLLSIMLTRSARRPPRHTAGYAIARGLACDPGDLGLRFEAWMLDRPGEVRLPVWEVNAADERAPRQGGTEARSEELNSPRNGENPAAGGMTAVFIHGWGQSRIDMLARIEPWRELCHRLVFYDLRGHGEAEGSHSNLGCREADDLLALLERLGDGPVMLVGCSMGAIIAFEAAAKSSPVRDRIAGIVAYGPYADFHRSLRGRLAVAGYPARPITDLTMLWFRLLGLRHPPTERAVSEVDCPILIVHGTADRVAPIEDAERLAAVASDAVLCRIEEGQHLDASVMEAPEHLEAVREFVASVGACRAVET